MGLTSKKAQSIFSLQFISGVYFSSNRRVVWTTFLLHVPFWIMENLTPLINKPIFIIWYYWKAFLIDPEYVYHLINVGQMHKSMLAHTRVCCNNMWAWDKESLKLCTVTPTSTLVDLVMSHWPSLVVVHRLLDTKKIIVVVKYC